MEPSGSGLKVKGATIDQVSGRASLFLRKHIRVMFGGLLSKEKIPMEGRPTEPKKW